MSFKLRARCLRCNFKNGDFRIFSWSPITNIESLKLSPYMTFSSKGEDSYIVEGKDYELEVEEISCDPKYGSCVRIISVPSMAGLDFKTLTRAESFEILMDCTSSEKIANNILDAYPNFIEKILTEGQESIDLSLIHGVGSAYLNAYTRNLTEKYKYYGMLQRFKEYEINITDIKQLISEYTDENSIDTAFKENPYKILISILNRSFENADKLIMSIRPELAHSELRCAYLILSVLEQSENEGDTYTDANDLYFYILNEYPIAKELEDLIVPVVQTSELFYYEEETHRVAIATTYNGECMIADLVREKGLRFGLWFEIERASAESENVKNHKEFYIWDKGHYYVDFANREACDFIYGILKENIDKYGVEFIKFDLNGSLTFDKTRKSFITFVVMIVL